MDFEAFWQDLEHQRSSRGSGAASLVALRITPSSHQLARRILKEYGAEETAVPAIDLIAWEQAAGHGREGRPWSSPPAAGIYASLVRSISRELVPRLPVLVPVALASVVNERLDGRCRIKWPNDLVVNGGKLGGILIDVMTQGETESRGAAISFGVNVAADVSQLGDNRAVSLGSLGAPEESLSQLANAFLDCLNAMLLDPERGSIERYRELSAHQLGDVLSWRHQDQTIQGTFAGFNEAGFLRLIVDGQERLVTAGDLLASEGEAPAAESASADGH